MSPLKLEALVAKKSTLRLILQLCSYLTVKVDVPIIVNCLLTTLMSYNRIDKDAIVSISIVSKTGAGGISLETTTGYCC